MRVILELAAQADLQEAYDYFERQDPGSGDVFLEKVQSALDEIADRPEMYALVEADARNAKVKQTQYLVFYRIRPNQIEVISVFHGARDPNIWRRRL